MKAVLRDDIAKYRGIYRGELAIRKMKEQAAVRARGGVI